MTRRKEPCNAIIRIAITALLVNYIDDNAALIIAIYWYNGNCQELNKLFCKNIYLGSKLKELNLSLIKCAQIRCVKSGKFNCRLCYTENVLSNFDVLSEKHQGPVTNNNINMLADKLFLSK